MGILDRLKPKRPEATLAELEEQLTAASSAQMDAADAVEAAQAAFDAEGDDATLKALVKARDEHGRAELVLQRAERLHAAAVERQGAARRAELEAERDQLAAETTHAAVLEAGAALAREEAEQIIRLARVRARRVDLARELGRKHHRRMALDRELGVAVEGGIYVDEAGRSRTRTGPSDHSAAASGPIPVEKALGELRHELDETARRLLRHVEPDVDHYRI